MHPNNKLPSVGNGVITINRSYTLEVMFSHTCIALNFMKYFAYYIYLKNL